MRRTRAAILGSGRVARALVPALRRARIECAAVWSRNAREGRSVARAARATFCADLSSIPADVNLLFFAISDDGISSVASTIARQAPLRWNGVAAMHFAGALPASLLAPLRKRGAEIFSMHPATPVGGSDPYSPQRRVRWAVEARAGYRTAAFRLARKLGGTPWTISAKRKAEYHAALVLSSNAAIAFAGLAEQILERAGLPRIEARNAVAKQIADTINPIRQVGASKALTGPASRGDLATLQRSLRVLRGPERDAYRAASIAAAAVKLMSEPNPARRARLKRVIAEMSKAADRKRRR
jgi:predicted short-subunit dehydrogenase-like oxidoreductase (DUF2520 family)